MKQKSAMVAALTGIALFLLFGCGSKELNKTTATKMIKEKFHLPVTENTWTMDNYSPEAKGYRELLNMGLISVQEQRGYFSYSSHYSVTEEGKKYFVEEQFIKGAWNKKESKLIFKSHAIDIADISVSSNAKQKKAEVLVTLKIVDLTPFGQYLDGYEEGMTFQNKLNFQLYDDGWKLVEDEHVRSFLFHNPREIKRNK